jgi:hypothetical protein
MPSIQASSYTVSAMVPSLLPAPVQGNSTKLPAPKTDTVIPADAGRSVSDRVTAFLATDPGTKTAGNRPDGPPPPPGGGMGPRGAGANKNEAASESETALKLLEADETSENDQDADDIATQTTAVQFDEAKNYYPTSIY